MTDGHKLAPSRGAIDAKLRAILSDVLGLDADRVADFDSETGLFGHLPELDSMAVVALITSLEDRFGFTVDDDEVEGSTFATVGSLVEFVEGKMAG